MKSTFYTVVESDQEVQLPQADYWRDRLTCRGCSFPLTPPIFYCYNSAQVHPLCRNCDLCNVPNCLSKVSPNRSVVLEKLIGLACFSCEFSCKKSLLEASEYKPHVRQCHFRPIACSICQNVINFREYFQHLRHGHEMRKTKLNQETLILDFSRGQPRIQYIRFNDEIFLIRYENLKLWVDLLSVHEDWERFYKIRVSGVKYKIELEMKVRSPRESQEIPGNKSTIFDDDENNNNAHHFNNNHQELKTFVIPPPDEELFLIFIYDGPSEIVSSCTVRDLRLFQSNTAKRTTSVLV